MPSKCKSAREINRLELRILSGRMTCSAPSWPRKTRSALSFFLIATSISYWGDFIPTVACFPLVLGEWIRFCPYSFFVGLSFSSFGSPCMVVARVFSLRLGGLDLLSPLAARWGFRRCRPRVFVSHLRSIDWIYHYSSDCSISARVLRFRRFPFLSADRCAPRPCFPLVRFSPVFSAPWRLPFGISSISMFV